MAKVMYATPDKLGKLTLTLGLAASAFFFAAPVEAQYFGRNKVQYEDFEFQVLQTDHWDIHYYPEAEVAVEDIARMAERWYERFARSYQHEFDKRKPLIIYADHPDFQQTNTLAGAINQGTGGVTEFLKDRVIMPLTGSYRETDRILGHELIHAFQLNIAKGRNGAGVMNMARLPLWLIEGTAEYMSMGREHPLTAMWMRDHILRDEKPDLKEITRDPRYFAYRFGQGMISYLGGTYGDDAVIDLYRTALRIGWEPAVNQVFGMAQDTLSQQWWDAMAERYEPLMEGKTDPYETGTPLISPQSGSGRMNIAPSLSPDGQYVILQTEKDLFSVDLFLADANTGEIIRPLQRNETPYVDGIRYIDSSGSWSPDSRKIAFVVFAGGNNQLAILDVQSGNLDRRIEIDEVGAIQNPAWSPDGSTIAFTGLKGGIADLYLFDVASGRVEQVTNDKHTEIHPTWSPDGSTLAFVTDRGPDTDFETLTFGEYVLAFLDMDSRELQPYIAFPGAKHTNPVYDKTGEGLYFVSDPDGFADIYHVDLVSGDLTRMTEAVTGVSGITMLAPAFSYAPGTDVLAFSVFHERGFIINTTPGNEGMPVRIAQSDGPHPGRLLPPARPAVRSRVDSYLGDSQLGLYDEGVFNPESANDYDPSFQLDYIGQPTIGVGNNTFGSYIGGGAAATFSDMLGDRFLGVAVQANGTFKDIGGSAFYLNQEKRLNWGASIQHTPYLRQFFAYGPGSFDVIRERIYIDAASGLLAYPLSSTRRVEASLGATRYGFNLERERLFTDQFGQIIDVQREDLPSRDPLSLATVSLAFVGDNSFSAFVGPVRGERFRFEAEAAVGTVNFQTLTADYRKYFNNGGPATLAFRALHLGRYGDIQSLDEQQLGTYFLGYETLIRGYAYDSFNQRRECTVALNGSSCPEIDRLFAHRIGVVNLEVRLPFTGIEEFGILNFPYIPIELTAFTDVGVAWDSEREATFSFSRDSSQRQPLVASGFSARFNLLGFLLLEGYYAYPWQRPEKGWHWGFHIAPGW